MNATNVTVKLVLPLVLLALIGWGVYTMTKKHKPADPMDDYFARRKRIEEDYRKTHPVPHYYPTGLLSD